MSETQYRSPEELEQDIRRTRSEIDRTLSALQGSLSPVAVLDRAVRTTRDGGGVFVDYFGRAVRDNPIPLALLGVSLTWLVLSSRNHPEKPQQDSGWAGDAPVREDPNRPDTDYTTRTETAASPQSPEHDSGAQFTKGPDKSAFAHASDMRDRAKATAKDASDKVGSTYEHVRQRAGEAYDQASETMHGLRRDASAKADEIHRRASDVSGRAVARGEGAYSAVRDYAREHPLVVGALAVAAGAALAALIPAARRVHDRISAESGPENEDAENPTAEQMDTVIRAGRAAAEQAQKEQKRREVDPDHLRQDLNRKAQGAATVMDAAARTAATEAKREAPTGKSKTMSGSPSSDKTDVWLVTSPSEKNWRERPDNSISSTGPTATDKDSKTASGDKSSSSPLHVSRSEKLSGTPSDS